MRPSRCPRDPGVHSLLATSFARTRCATIPKTQRLHHRARLRRRGQARAMCDYGGPSPAKNVLRQWFSYRKADRTRPVIGEPPPSVRTCEKDQSPKAGCPNTRRNLIDLLNVLGAASSRWSRPPGRASFCSASSPPRYLDRASAGSRRRVRRRSPQPGASRPVGRSAVRGRGDNGGSSSDASANPDRLSKPFSAISPPQFPASTSAVSPTSCLPSVRPVIASSSPHALIRWAKRREEGTLMIGHPAGAFHHRRGHGPVGRAVRGLRANSAWRRRRGMPQGRDGDGALLGFRQAEKRRPVLIGLCRGR